VVIAVLAVIWVVALTPMILRKLSERRFTTSVDSFHRQLRGLRRAYPRLAASAAHPEMAMSMARMAHGGVRTSSMTASPVSHYEAVELDQSSTRAPFDTAGANGQGSSSRTDQQVTRPIVRMVSGVRRHHASQSVRRRRVLVVLVATVLGFFLLGIIPALRILWDASLLAFGLTAAYLALLIHFHRRAVERDIKVIDLRRRRGDPGVGVPATGVLSPGWESSADVPWADDALTEAGFSGDYDKIVAGGH